MRAGLPSVLALNTLVVVILAWALLFVESVHKLPAMPIVEGGATRVTASAPFTATTSLYFPLLIKRQPMPGQATGALALASQIGGLSSAVVVRGQVAYVGEGAKLSLVDISDPSNPRLIGDVALPQPVVDVAAADDYAYVATRLAVYIVDVSQRAEPRRIGVYMGYGGIYSIAAGSGRLYIGSYLGLHIVDVSTPATPREVGMFSTGQSKVTDIVVAGAYAYILGDAGALALDVSDPAAPRRVSVLAGGSDGALFVSAGYAYVASGSAVWISDVSNPAAPQQVGSYITSDDSRIQALVVVGGYAYVTVTRYGIDDGLRVVNMSNPAQPVEVTTYSSARTWSVAASEGYVFLVGLEGGMEIVDVSRPGEPHRQGLYTTPGRTTAIAVTGGYAYTISTINGATAAANNTWLHIVELVESGAPRVIGALSLPGYGSDVVVEYPHAFVALDEGGLRVIDIAHPQQPREVGAYVSANWPIGKVVVAGQYAFVTRAGTERRYGDPDLRVIDITNPGAPREVAQLDVGVELHGIDVQGAYGYVVDEMGGMRVIDVAAPTAPRVIGYYPYASLTGVIVAGAYAYCMERGALHVVDVSDPTTPRQVQRYLDPEATAGRQVEYTALAVEGSYLYLALSVPGGAGPHTLRGFDITQPATLRETGNYDMPQVARDLDMTRGHVYVADNTAGVLLFQPH